jgi:hypothetical protein
VLSEPSVVGVVVIGVVGVVGVVLFPDASLEYENNENALSNIPFPEASVVFPEASVVFPEASVDCDENNENGSKFGENKSLTLVVPPNNDEIILLFSFLYYICIFVYRLFIKKYIVI